MNKRNRIYKIIGDNEETRKHCLRITVLLNTNTHEMFTHQYYIMSSGGMGYVRDINGNETDQYSDILDFLFSNWKEEE